MNKPLPIMEQFYTLQGEGHFAGQAAYFIRLSGCDVGCVWCDVKESWDAARHPEIKVSAIVNQALQHASRLAVITGGEPLMHNCTPLTSALKTAGFRCHVETSGSSPLSGEWDWICFSPKKFKAPLPEYYELANELKVVVYNKHDLNWANSHAQKVNTACRLYLQPEWSEREAMTPLLVDFVKQNPRWQVSLQTHKYLNIP